MKRLLAAFLLSGLGAVAAAAAGPILLVPSGSVDVRSGPTAPWRQITTEEKVVAGDEVRTSRTSMAELRFVDGSRVQMGIASLFNIDKTDSKETSFTLKAGKIRAAFAGLLSSRVSIRTPTAVCAVRGTVFDIGADDKGNTEVSMAEGVLEVKDNKGREAVITSEETMKIGEGGMERPHIVALNDDRALAAVRPYAVHQEMARDATRKMLEDMRNRELKSNEAQLGKDVVDAFGRRVRLEEYLLRPTDKSYEVLFLSRREERFDWGHLVQTFHSTIPDDISLVPAIVRGTFLSATQPSNWLTGTEFYATNTRDALKESIVLGDPALISFSGYGAGSLWYPSSVDFTQTLYGPGVPNGERIQFVQHQDWNNMTLGAFTWYQAVQPTAGQDNLSLMFLATLDPTNAADVTQGYTSLGVDHSLYDFTPTAISYPNGAGKADFKQETTYPDNSTVSVEKFLINNDGTILDRSAASASDFARNGNYNIEINIKSSLFQSRDIDVLIAPEILRVKSAATSTGGNILAQ